MLNKRSAKDRNPGDRSLNVAPPLLYSKLREEKSRGIPLLITVSLLLFNNAASIKGTESLLPDSHETPRLYFLISSLHPSQERCASGNMCACACVCVHPVATSMFLTVTLECSVTLCSRATLDALILEHQQLRHLRPKMASEEIDGAAERLIYASRGLSFTRALQQQRETSVRDKLLLCTRHKCKEGPSSLTRSRFPPLFLLQRCCSRCNPPSVALITSLWVSTF